MFGLRVYFILALGLQSQAQLLTHILAPLSGYVQKLPHIDFPTQTTAGSETTTFEIDSNDIQDGNPQPTKPFFSLENLLHLAPLKKSIDSTTTSKPVDPKLESMDKGKTATTTATVEEIPAFRVDNEVIAERPIIDQPRSPSILPPRRTLQQQLQMEQRPPPPQTPWLQQQQQFVPQSIQEAYRKQQQQLKPFSEQQPLAFVQDSTIDQQNRFSPTEDHSQIDNRDKESTTPKSEIDQESHESPWAISGSKSQFNKQPSIVEASANETTTSTPTTPSSITPQINNALANPSQNQDPKPGQSARDYLKSVRRLHFADENRLQNSGRPQAINQNQNQQQQQQQRYVSPEESIIRQ